MKASAITLSIVFCLLSLSAIGQSYPKNSLKVGFGTAYLNSGDYFGRHRYIEYQRSFIPLLGLGLNAGMSDANKNLNDLQKISTRAYQGEANLYLAPIHNRVNSLKLGFGGVYRKAEDLIEPISPSADGLENVVHDETSEFGYSALLEYELYIAKHLTMGTRASYQQFKSGNKVFYWGLNAGFRF